MTRLEVPKAHISKGDNAMDLLLKMLQSDPALYDKCIQTPGFAFGFSQLANRAIHFDFLQNVAGVIPKDYPEKFQAEKNS